MFKKNENHNGINVRAIKGIGPKGVERLARLGIETIQDLLLHLPVRYQDRTKKTLIKDLRHGDFAVVEAFVDSSNIKFGRRRSLLVEIHDQSGSLGLRFFYFSSSLKEKFLQGSKICCFGEVRNGPNSFELIHPEYFFLDKAITDKHNSKIKLYFPKNEK